MDWFDRLPKVELHIHLEGAIPHQALWELICKYGGDPSVPDMQALQRRFQYRDFSHFIETWSWKNGFLREYEDFARIAKAAASDLADQNIRYAEMLFSPSLFVRRGLEVQALTIAVRSGLAQEPRIQVALVADLVRDYGPERELAVLQKLREVRDQGVVGIGIGGSEQEFPPEPFATLFETAREFGFRTNAHAGEAAGCRSVWSALRILRAERIGHGVRAREDPALVDYLAEHRVPLEMCPISNLRTNVVSGVGEHPVRDFHRRGLLVTINTDDPKMFGNSLAEELRLLHKELGFSAEDVRRLQLNAVEACWLPEDGKRALAEAITVDPAWAGNESSCRT
jgi:adenosine deaminase